MEIEIYSVLVHVHVLKKVHMVQVHVMYVKGPPLGMFFDHQKHVLA